MQIPKKPARPLARLLCPPMCYLAASLPVVALFCSWANAAEEVKPAEEKKYLYRGIAGRAFERRLELADHIKVNGKLINPQLKAREKVYVLLNKPRGYLTSVSDPEGRPLVVNLLPPALGRVQETRSLHRLRAGAGISPAALGRPARH